MSPNVQTIGAINWLGARVTAAILTRAVIDHTHFVKEQGRDVDPRHPEAFPLRVMPIYESFVKALTEPKE